MSQTDSKIKINSHKLSVSREFKSQDMAFEKVHNETTQEKKEGSDFDQATNRRELFKVLIPATGKAIAGILRNLHSNISLISEDVKTSKK
jgi:hypothetical protein